MCGGRSAEGKGKTILFGISQMALMLLADLMYSRSLTVLLGDNILNELLLHPVLLTSIKLLYALFLLLLNFGFCSIWSRLVSHGETGWDAPFLLFILGQCVSIIMLDYFIWTLTPEMPLTLSLLCLLVGVLLVSGVVLLRLFAQAKEYYRAQERQRMLERQLDLRRARQSELEANTRQVGQLSDQLRGQLEAARQSISERDLPRAGGALDRASKQLKAVQGTYCAHPVIDAVLADKVRRCEAEHIRLELALDLPPELPQDGPALCSLFGNLLDNAVEACLRLPEGERVIRCRAGCRGGYLVVEEENPLPPPLDEAARQSRVRAGRGLGLEILSGIARRYGGEVETQQGDDRFQVTVWLGLDALPEGEGENHG
ncbi:Sensor protein PhoQ [uncultured Flavonifractor sp.]|nr:Sensor protein PhoQ [uncultured Flavonifractor sp.]